MYDIQYEGITKELNQVLYKSGNINHFAQQQLKLHSEYMLASYSESIMMDKRLTKKDLLDRITNYIAGSNIEENTKPSLILTIMKSLLSRLHILDKYITLQTVKKIIKDCDLDMYILYDDTHINIIVQMVNLVIYLIEIGHVSWVTWLFIFPAGREQLKRMYSSKFGHEFILFIISFAMATTPKNGVDVILNHTHKIFTKNNIPNDSKFKILTTWNHILRTIISKYGSGDGKIVSEKYPH